jgi:hypothetical protein
MRWHEIVEDTSITDLAKSFIMDILAPLKAQGVASITVQQVIDQLSANPDFEGNTIEADLVMDALKDVNGLDVRPSSESGDLTIFINQPSENRPSDDKQDEKDAKSINAAAMRTINKGDE